MGGKSLREAVPGLVAVSPAIKTSLVQRWAVGAYKKGTFSAEANVNVGLVLRFRHGLLLLGVVIMRSRCYCPVH
jgi:hypothetical protein